MTTPQGTIFDLYEEDDQAEKEKVIAERPRAAQIVREIGLGAVQGAGDIAELMSMIEGAITAPINYGLLDEEGRKAVTTPGQDAIADLLYAPETSESDFIALAADDDDLAPPPQLPGQRAQLSQALSEIPEEGITQEITRRVTRSLPGLVGGGAVFADMAIRDLVGLGGKKIAEHMGFGETGQMLFDLGFSLASNPKKFIEPGKRLINMAARGEKTTEKAMVEAARRMGMTEAEIAPLVRDGWFANILRKLSPRRGSVQTALHETSGAVGRNYENLAKGANATKSLSKGAKTSFLQNLMKELEGLPAGAREAIAGDLADLQKSGMTGADIMNFWGDLNANFRNWPSLGGLKNSLRGALKSLSPTLAHDFEIANTLSQRFRDVSKALKPNVGTDLFGATEALGMLGSLFYGAVYGGLESIKTSAPYHALLVGGRKLAQEMLTNPRYQNLMKKMVTTLNAGQAKNTMDLLGDLTKMVRKQFPEMAEELETITLEDMEAMLAGQD